MAQRNLLHKSKLEDFKTWLIGDGWNIEEPKPDSYEVLRAQKGKRKLIVYRNNHSDEHLSVREQDEGVVRAYIKARREKMAHWKLDVENEQAGYAARICSNCNTEIIMDIDERYARCPACNAEMSNGTHTKNIDMHKGFREERRKENA